jgi:hypothetical protein
MLENSNIWIDDQELFRLKGVDGYNQFCLNKTDEVRDIAYKVVTAGVGFDQVAPCFRQSRFHRLPVGPKQSPDTR